MTTREPGDVVGRCPVCQGLIDLLNPQQVPRPANGSLEEHIQAVVSANETLILTHAQTNHSIHDVMVALGVARQALMEIEHNTQGWAEFDTYLRPVIHRGLGEGE